MFTKEENDSKSNRTESVDLGGSSDPNSSDFLKIEISDALHEKDKVKFTVKTKVNLLVRDRPQYIYIKPIFLDKFKRVSTKRVVSC